jgi:hypothetical protein
VRVSTVVMFVVGVIFVFSVLFIIAVFFTLVMLLALVMVFIIGMVVMGVIFAFSMVCVIGVIFAFGMVFIVAVLVIVSVFVVLAVFVILGVLILAQLDQLNSRIDRDKGIIRLAVLHHRHERFFNPFTHHKNHVGIAQRPQILWRGVVAMRVGPYRQQHLHGYAVTGHALHHITQNGRRCHDLYCLAIRHRRGAKFGYFGVLLSGLFLRRCD